MVKTLLVLLLVLTMSFDGLRQLPGQGGSDAVNLLLTNNKLTVNGETLIEMRGKCGGPILAFHEPERGWFVLSTKPVEGYDFQKVGQLVANKLTFVFNHDFYEWVNDDPIGANSETADIWVLHLAPPGPESKEPRVGKVISCSSNLKTFLEHNILNKKP